MLFFEARISTIFNVITFVFFPSPFYPNQNISCSTSLLKPDWLASNTSLILMVVRSMDIQLFHIRNTLNIKDKEIDDLMDRVIQVLKNNFKITQR